MQLKRIEVDHNFQERVHYKNPSFPVDICTDVYNMFVDNTLNCHWHEEFEFGVVLTGEVEYYINDTHFHLSVGDGVFINSNTMHMSRQSEGCTGAVMFTVMFPDTLFGADTSGTVYQKYMKPFMDNRIKGFKMDACDGGMAEMTDNLTKLYNMDYETFGYELKCIRLLCGVWLEVVCSCACEESTSYKANRDMRSEERVKSMLSYIHTHYRESLTVEKISKAAKISRSECFSCFKRMTNKKPVEYINEYRLAKASGMLVGTDKPVSEICAECGFGSPSYFSKLFREKCGISPNRFRQKYITRREDIHASAGGGRIR